MGKDFFQEEIEREIAALNRGEYKRPTPAPLVHAEPGERIALLADAATHLVSMTFTSRSDNPQPHVVTVGYDDIPRCTCRASNPCWAVKGFCGVTGRPTP